MSGYKTHFLAGFIVTCITALVIFYTGRLDFTVASVCWLVAISFIYSLLPDIDIGTSIIRKIFTIIFVVFIFINGINTVGYILGIAVIVIQFLPHRGIMHTYIAGALLSGLLYLYFNSWVFPIVALLNFVSHLILDEVT